MRLPRRVREIYEEHKAEDSSEWNARFRAVDRAYADGDISDAQYDRLEPWIQEARDAALAR